jgi:hypothetical protein
MLRFLLSCRGQCLARMATRGCWVNLQITASAIENAHSFIRHWPTSLLLIVPRNKREGELAAVIGIATE